MNRRCALWLGLAAALGVAVFLAACAPAAEPTPTPAPAAKPAAPPAAPAVPTATTAPAPQPAAPAAPTATTAPAPKPAEPAKPTAAPAAPTPTAAAAAPAAKPSPPTAVLKIVPVPANKDHPLAIKGTLAAPTPVAIYMGTTGLTNVSIGVPVYLQGAATDPKAQVKYQWTLRVPTTSKAKLDDPAKAAASFVPDVSGVYKVDLVVSNEAGASPVASTQVQAGTYVGMEKGGCANCHKAQAAEWPKTGHGVIFSRELNGGAAPKDSHYAESCVRCHTTGYYQGVANGGFADEQAKAKWQFPKLEQIQTGKGNWEAVPAAMKNVANIQCEACHGPAAAHVAGQGRMVSTLDEGVCNTCHNGGGHHVKGEFLKNAKHADEASRAWTYPVGPARQDCVRCHSGFGFVSFINNPKESASWDSRPHTVTCAVCHEPHSEANTAQLRITGKPVEVAGVTKDFGLSTVCVECHNGRTTAQDAARGSYPHYSAAAEMMSNIGGVDYGQQLPNSVHGQIVGTAPIADPADKTGQAKLFLGATPGPCVACHMWPTPADAKDPLRYKVGDHSFNVVSPDGKSDYAASCQGCHAGVKDFKFAAKADYDGNGKTESVQAEVAGLLHTLEKAINDSGIRSIEGNPYFNRDDLAKANDKQKNAIYNYRFVRGLEHSDGKAAAIHNFKRAVALVQLSYKDLTGKDVPNATLMK